MWTKGKVTTRQIEWKILDICCFRFILIKWGRGMVGTLLYIPEASPYFCCAKDEVAFPDLTCTPTQFGEFWDWNEDPVIFQIRWLQCRLMQWWKAHDRQGTAKIRTEYLGPVEVGVVGIAAPLCPTSCPVWLSGEPATVLVLLHSLPRLA